MSLRPAYATLVIVTLLALGCTPDAADRTRDSGTPPAEAPAASTPAVSDSSAPPSGAAIDAADDPFAGFELPASTEASTERRSVPLLLRNDGRELALVYADGGAGEVFLDSVPAGESRRVDVQTRAGLIALRSETAAGDPLRRTEVTPGVPTVREVVVADTPRTP